MTRRAEDDSFGRALDEALAIVGEALEVVDSIWASWPEFPPAKIGLESGALRVHGGNLAINVNGPWFDWYWQTTSDKGWKSANDAILAYVEERTQKQGGN